MKFIRQMILGVLLSAVSISTVAAEPLSIYTVNYPLAYFAERIGGTQVEVIFPAPADVDPAHWMPDSTTIAAYQKADLILLNGANYAKWVGKVSLPRGKMINTTRKHRARYLKTKRATTHSHGAQGAHAHESLAFTTWLDFDLARHQAVAVTSAFSRAQPKQKAVFAQNLATLEKDLDGLDRAMKKLAAKSPTLPLVVSHPVYDYLGRAYGLNIRSVHWEPDEVPTVAKMAELKTLLKDHPAKWMVWEGQPDEGARSKLEEMGIKSAVFDPCGTEPGQGDFLTTMRNNIANLARVFE